jgi:SNF2 family DNA or RNA helicase
MTNHVKVVKNLIRVKTPFELAARIKDIPGARWDMNAREWTYPAYPQSAMELAQRLQGVEYDTNEEYDELRATGERGLAAAIYKEDKELPEIPLYKTSSWEWQRRGFYFARELPATMLNMDMGTGKTKVCIDLFNNLNCRNGLIICKRAAVLDVWPGEFDVHSPVDVMVIPLDEYDKDLSVAQKKQKAEKQIALAKALGRPYVLVINHASCWREPFGSWTLKQQWDMVIVDESHKIKSPTGKCSRYCAQLTKVSKYRLALSGTILAHSPLDIFAQYRFLDPSIFGNSFVAFRKRYALMGGYMNHKVVGYQNEQELHDRIFRIAYRVGNEVLNLIPAQSSTFHAELDASAKKLYRTLEREFWLGFDAGEVTLANSMTKNLRLRQIATGFVTLDDGSIQDLHSAKLSLLEDVLEDLPDDEPVVIFANFTHEINQIAGLLHRLDRTYDILDGHHDGLKHWKDGGSHDLIVQIQTGSDSINLTRARYSIYYSMGYNRADYDQSLARTHRPGSRGAVHIHLIMKNTVEEDVMEAIRHGREIADYILSNRPQRVEENLWSANGQ